jgi:hypothetical protein
MHKFRVFSSENPNIAWMIIEEGNINIETGIRFMYAVLNEDDIVIDRRVFLINGDDFSNIGISGKDTRIAIIELLLETIGCIIVQE